jgi:hypothetical protein
MLSGARCPRSASRRNAGKGEADPMSVCCVGSRRDLLSALIKTSLKNHFINKIRVVANVPSRVLLRF